MRACRLPQKKLDRLILLLDTNKRVLKNITVGIWQIYTNNVNVIHDTKRDEN